MTLKLRYSDFETHTKQQSLKKAIVTGGSVVKTPVGANRRATAANVPLLLVICRVPVIG